MPISTFRTAVVRTPGGPDSIEIIDVPLVEPGPGQVRVEIAAATVNPVDVGVAGGVFHRLGLVHQPDHTGMGWDFAGTVVAAGPDVDVAVGTRVAGLVDGFDRDFGTYAEQLVLPAAPPRSCLTGSTWPRPPRCRSTASPQRSSSTCSATARGGRLLVTGAAGAVGAYVVPLAQDRGWRVTGLARVEDEEFVRGLGADFTRRRPPGWDAVADGAVLQAQGVAWSAMAASSSASSRPRCRTRSAASPSAWWRREPDGARLARAARRHRRRPPAGTGPCRGPARSGRRRPPDGGEGRRARPVRPRTVTSLVPPDLARRRRPGAVRDDFAGAVASDAHG